MCNVDIAKNKLQDLKKRTEKDLYVLKYESLNIMPLNEDTYNLVKSVCDRQKLTCPLYKFEGEINFRKTEKNLYPVLHKLAEDHGIYLDHTKIND